MTEDSIPVMNKRHNTSSCKIVATLGPASDSREQIQRLLAVGVDVFRLNTSHGVLEDHATRLRRVREVSKEAGIHAGVLLDLQGPKIRLGTFVGGGCELINGSEFTITTEKLEGTAACASTSYAEFARDVRAGDHVLLADGAIDLEVVESDGVKACCRVVAGGWISDRKGINLPGVAVSAPSLTRKDKQDLTWGLENGIDFVALSFVRKASDVTRLRLFLEEKDQVVPIVAKIEKPEAWENLEAILQESDGVMVARGDLGVEMAIEKVPSIQKSIIEQARRHGKFVITATQMLESMIEHSYPTRAEVSDIANAIYDGTDAVMLSAETSAGKYPVEAAAMMSKIAIETEKSVRPLGYKDLPPRVNPSIAEVIADAAYHAARAASVAGIAVFTTTGRTAHLVARYRPPVPIFAFTQDEAVARQLSVVYGVRAIITPHAANTDEMLAQMDKSLIERGYLKLRDQVIMVAGQPIGRAGTTNLIKLHRVGELR